MLLLPDKCRMLPVVFQCLIKSCAGERWNGALGIYYHHLRSDRGDEQGTWVSASVIRVTPDDDRAIVLACSKRLFGMCVDGWTDG